MKKGLAAFIVSVGFAAVAAAQLVPQVPRGNVFNPELDRAKRHYDAGWALFRHEDWLGAAKEFHQAIDVAPKFAEGYYALGRAEMARRRYIDAIEALTRCRELYLASAGESITSQVNGTVRLEELILEQRMALQQLQQANTAKSQNQTSQLAIREMNTRLRQLESARDRNQNLFVDTSVPFHVPLSLGAAHFRAGHFDAAEREFKTAIEANSKSGETHNNLAVLYLTVGRIQEAATEVALAEKTGFKVNPGLKDDIAERRTARR